MTTASYTEGNTMAHGGAWRRLAAHLNRHLLLMLVVAYGIAALVPGPGNWLRGGAIGGSLRLTPTVGLLAVLLFNAGLGVSFGQVRRLPRTGAFLVVGLATSLIVPPAFLFGASLTLRLWHNPNEAQQVLVGLALVAAMPVAGSSTAWAQQADGDMALSLGIVLLSTLLSPLTTPLALQAAGAATNGEYAAALRNLAGTGTGLFLAGGVALPVVLGMAARLALGETRVVALRGPIKVVSAIALLILWYANAAAALPGVVADPDWDFLLVTAILTGGSCAAAFAGGWVVARTFRANPGQSASLVYGLGMSNNGTGLVIGASALAGQPAILLPVIVYNLLQHVAAATVHRFAICRCRSDRQGDH